MEVTLDELQRTAHYMSTNVNKVWAGDQKKSWALVVAHATQPSTHASARANAQRFLASQASRLELKNTNPCIHMGHKDARDYWKNLEESTLAPFTPACTVHGESYRRCDSKCLYGVQLNRQWLHDLVLSDT